MGEVPGFLVSSVGHACVSRDTLMRAFQENSGQAVQNYTNILPRIDYRTVAIRKSKVQLWCKTTTAMNFSRRATSESAPTSVRHLHAKSRALDQRELYLFRCTMLAAPGLYLGWALQAKLRVSVPSSNAVESQKSTADVTQSVLSNDKSCASVSRETNREIDC